MATCSKSVWPDCHHDLARVDHRLEDRHRAVEEERGVVVVGGPGEQLHVVGALALGLQALDERLGLEHADLEVVEGRVVVDRVGLPDQTVVGDDLDVLALGGLEHVTERGAVDRGDDEDVHALGDHVLHLGDLGRDVVLGVLEVDLVAGVLELRLDVVAVGDPALRRLGRHGDTDAPGVSAAFAASSPHAARLSARLPAAIMVSSLRTDLLHSSCVRPGLSRALVLLHVPGLRAHSPAASRW